MFNLNSFNYKRLLWQLTQPIMVDIILKGFIPTFLKYNALRSELKIGGAKALETKYMAPHIWGQSSHNFYFIF